MNVLDDAVASITQEQARAVAQALQLDVEECGLCKACLSFVSFPLEAGDEREVRRALAYITPHLWEDGLEQHAVAALERAERAGIPHADAALADVNGLGPRSRVVREIVLLLAAAMTRSYITSQN